MSVVDAVHCAVEIQEVLQRANEGELEEQQMRFRIGINVGDVMAKEGDIFGDGVNVAARLEGLVKGGEICVSRGVRDHLRHRGGFVFEDLGEQLVKNIAHPIRAFRLCTGQETSERPALSPEEILEPSELPSASAAFSDLSADNEVALELALWDSVKEGSPAELESYLEQYPEGTFASVAQTRLDTATHPSAAGPTAPTPAEIAADALDLAFWESIKDSNRREELQAYLEQHPNGHFAGLARARLSSSEAP
jgi:adenylate cyclase